MLETIKEQIKSTLENFYQLKYEQEIGIVVEEPKNPELGDISIPIFSVVKAMRRPLPEVVFEAKEEILKASSAITSVSNVGGFINVCIDKKLLAKDVLVKAIELDSNYGASSIGVGKRVTLDYSSPNIAKSFSIGHLRSTMIGNSLRLILDKCGFETYSINYLGDWGTQFGKMIVAYKKWGNYEDICKDPITQLTNLYVRFHEEAKEHPQLEDEAREAFRKMELKDTEYLELWRWIREESLKESAQIYDLLGIKFDSYNGEAFYNDKMDPVVKELADKNLLKEDQGAQIVDLGETMPPALIKRKDGGSLYITRDLAAVFYRKQEYQFDHILYVVGNEQKLHFTQLKCVLQKMGYDFADAIEHVNFGLYLTDGKKMSTRKGGVVKLYDVLMKAIQLAYELVAVKNPELENKEEVAKAVGIAAIVFADLKNHRSLDIEFNLEQAVKFEGQTGPYLQYTSVRIASILKNKGFDVHKCKIDVFEKPHYFDLIKQISLFKSIIERAALERAPSIISRYLLNLAQSFNKFYSLEKINVEEETTRNANFALAKATRIVLNEGLRLLGIQYVNEM